MSIELRFDDDGRVVCSWGVIEHPDPRPDLNELGHLIIVAKTIIVRDLVEASYVYRSTDPDGRHRWQEYTATERDGRQFVHTAYPVYSHSQGIPADDGSEHPPTAAKRWTWELFEAHFADGQGPEAFIGRWPD